MPSTLDLSTYLNSYGHTLTLVEYLSKELSRHPQLAEIPLLGEDGDGLTISQDAAWEVILTYLKDNNLSSKYLTILENPRLAKPKKLEVVLDFLHDKEIELPLANLAIENNLAAYQASLEIKATNLNPSSPLQKAFAVQREQIKKYHEGLHALQSAAFSASTITRSQLEKLLPPSEVFSDQELSHIQDKLISLLPTLSTSSKLSSVQTPEAIHKTLSQLASKDKALSKFVVLNSSNEKKALLASFVASTTQNYEQNTGQSISLLEKSQRAISNHSLQSVALPRLETEKIISQILAGQGLMSPTDATSFASQLFTESVRSAYLLNRPVTVEELISSALVKFDISPKSPEAKSLSKAVAPLSLDLLTHNQTQILEARRKGFVPGPTALPGIFLPSEVKLALSTNTDPALISTNPPALLQQLFTQYGVNNVKALEDLAKKDGNIPLLTELSFINDYQAQLARFNSSLTPAQKLSVGLIRAQNTLNRGLYSYQKTTTQAWDKIYEFNEKLDRLNPIARATNWWANTEENIMATNWGWLNPVGKGVQVFDAWRSKTVNNILQKYQLNPPKSKKDRFINWATQMYYQGGFTLSGFATQTLGWAASTFYEKAIKASAKKVGAWLLKKGTVLAIKILGEAAVEQIAGSIIPVIGNVLAVIATVADIAKTLWQNRELIVDLIKKGAVIFAGFGFALWSLIAAFLAQLGTAFLGAALGATIGFLVVGPVGAIVGGIFGAVAGYFAASISAAIASGATALASFGSAIMGALATAATSITTFVVGIISVTAFTALTVITAMTTAEIPAPNTYAVFPEDQIVCSEDKLPIKDEWPRPTSSAIASRGWEIVSDLYQGFWCYWNRSPGDRPEDITTYPPPYPEYFDYPRFKLEPNIDPSVASQYWDILFWCTWLVIKSYNEGGSPLPTTLLGAASMELYFKDTSEPYTYIPNSEANSTNIVPGTVIFFQVYEGHPGTNHVALVTKVNEDAIYYIQSNGSVKEGTLSFSSSGVAGPSWAAIPGFGTL